MPAAGNSALRKLNTGILTACIIGLGLSYYAYIVETKKEQDASYEAMCDISEHISCTKVFMSETNRLVAIERDWLLLLEPTNQRRNPAENPQLLSSAERSHLLTICSAMRYGKGFGLIPKNSVFNVPNSIYGLAFYTQVAILSMINNYTCSAAVVVLGILSNICSIYLAHILYMFNDICVVCISTYIVNAAITYFGIKKFRKLSMNDGTRKQKIK